MLPGGVSLYLLILQCMPGAPPSVSICNIKTRSLGDDKLVKDFKKIVMRSETGLSPLCLVLVQAMQSEAGGRGAWGGAVMIRARQREASGVRV